MNYWLSPSTNGMTRIQFLSKKSLFLLEKPHITHLQFNLKSNELLVITFDQWNDSNPIFIKEITFSPRKTTYNTFAVDLSILHTFVIGRETQNIFLSKL